MIALFLIRTSSFWDDATDKQKKEFKKDFEDEYQIAQSKLIKLKDVIQKTFTGVDIEVRTIILIILYSKWAEVLLNHFRRIGNKTNDFVVTPKIRTNFVTEIKINVLKVLFIKKYVVASILELGV